MRCRGEKPVHHFGAEQANQRRSTRMAKAMSSCDLCHSASCLARAVTRKSIVVELYQCTRYKSREANVDFESQSTSGNQIPGLARRAALVSSTVQHYSAVRAAGGLDAHVPGARRRVGFEFGVTWIT